MVNLDKIKQIQKEISQGHQDLIKSLDSVDLEILSVTPTKENTTKVGIDITLFEEITNLASKLYDKDLQISKLLKKSPSSTNKEIKDLRRNLVNMKRLVIENSKIISKDLKRISLILSEYKERCRSSFVEFLKTLEMDLRKTLKPLVPSEVLQEQICFKPICTDFDLLSSMNSAKPEENHQFSMENTVDKLNNHISLLVNTLEDVAKNLIVITQGTYRSYYELVDPKMLASDPPSPLAAPLPEYFSYDIGNISDENRKKENIKLTGMSKERLIQKFLALQKSNGIKSPLTARKIKDKIEGMLVKDVKEADLLQFFKEEGIPVSEREKLVFEIIHSERSEMKDASLEDIIFDDERRSYSKPKIFYEKKIEKKTEQKAEKDKINKEKVIHADDSDFYINTLESFVQEKELPRNYSKINLIEQRSELVPSLNIKSQANYSILETKESVNSKQARASTPGKLKKVKKNPKKRTKTPVLKKKSKLKNK